MIDLCAFLEKVVGDKSCIWIFNIDAEKIWFSEDITVSQDNFDFITGMESINLLVCRKQDYVILRKFPNQDVLNHLQQHGVNIFNIIVPQIYDTQKSISECILQDDEILNLLRKNKDTYVLFPYAVTYLEEEISVKTGIKVIGAKEKIARLINDKIFSRNLANKLNFNVCMGDIFDNVNDAFAYYKKYFGNKKVILKKSHGASGKGLYIIEDEKQFECIIRKAKYFKLQNECILEKFYDNK
ncbi:MAG: phosphoribosylaminoimidazole carboxylase (NCAIR synthetase), partial [Oscillospiraceae bacterium]